MPLVCVRQRLHAAAHAWKYRWMGVSARFLSGGVGCSHGQSAALWRCKRDVTRLCKQHGTPAASSLRRTPTAAGLRPGTLLLCTLLQSTILCRGIVRQVWRHRRHLPVTPPSSSTHRNSRGAPSCGCPAARVCGDARAAGTADQGTYTFRARVLCLCLCLSVPVCACARTHAARVRDCLCPVHDVVTHSTVVCVCVCV